VYTDRIDSITVTIAYTYIYFDAKISAGIGLRITYNSC